MTPLEIVCFKWRAATCRTHYGPETVNALKQMLQRHYPAFTRLTCVTDDPAGIDKDVRIVPIWSDHSDVPSPHGGDNPSCYRRLKLFSPEAKTLIGDRFVAIDLDCVLVNDVTPVFERADQFAMLGDTNPRTHYNGSLLLLEAGSRTQVWDQFDPRLSPRKSLQAGLHGSDQGHISYVLGPKEAKWTEADGVYSFRNYFWLKRHQNRCPPLPANARIVVFHGRLKPWSRDVQELDWVRAHYPPIRQGVAA